MMRRHLWEVQNAIILNVENAGNKSINAKNQPACAVHADRRLTKLAFVDRNRESFKKPLNSIWKG